MAVWYPEVTWQKKRSKKVPAMGVVGQEKNGKAQWRLHEALFLSCSQLPAIPSFPHIHLGTRTSSPFPFSMDSYLQTLPSDKYLPHL